MNNEPLPKVSTKITILVVIILIMIPSGLFYMLNFGNPLTNLLTNIYVPRHLEEMGYKSEQIKEAHYVEPKRRINKDFYHGHYMVIFADEPDTTYYYGITKKGIKVIQFCEKDRLLPNGVTDTVRTETKHSEESCISSYKNR